MQPQKDSTRERRLEISGTDRPTNQPDRSRTNPIDRVKPPHTQSAVQHACSGGVASAPVCGGAGGAGGGGGEGGEAVRSRVPEGRRLHLRRLPLEEAPRRDRHGGRR